MKFFVQKLGCPKNDVDADYISARLIADGHTPVDDPEEADSIIVNTCGFIQAAKEESLEEIFRLSRLKDNKDGQQLLATGCLSQRYGEEMLKDMPELDGTFGHGTLDQLADAVSGKARARTPVPVNTHQLAYIDWKDRFISDSFPYAYVKISDGCDRLCTFCAIPGMRGKYRSRTAESIANEARYLAANGKRELILVSQEATLWGAGLKGERGIVNLLRRLDEIDGVNWIRLMYLYPTEVRRPLLEHLAADNKTLDYLDLPLQHISTAVLKRMKRAIDRPATDRLLDTIREITPEAVIRTTFMVGFPGETEQDFEELYDFVAEQHFHRLGIFPFSAEEGTPAAEMSDQIPEELKIERMERLMQLQQGIAIERNNSLIGHTLDVIIDTVDPEGTAIGRSRGDCPDIDQEVFLRPGKPGNHSEVAGLPHVGEIVRARIEDIVGYDLTGVRVTE